MNRAIPASTAFLFATCLSHHVPPDADLVTLEFTVGPKAASRAACVCADQLPTSLRPCLSVQGGASAFIMPRLGACGIHPRGCPALLPLGR